MALIEGNTTANTDYPRGLGLNLILDFIKENEGKMSIILLMDSGITKSNFI